MTRIDFEKIERRVSRTFKCSGCGKRRTRAHTFWQTMNPYNKNARGAAKSEAEIRAELESEARAFSPAKCASCESEPPHAP